MNTKNLIMSLWATIALTSGGSFFAMQPQYEPTLYTASLPSQARVEFEYRLDIVNHSSVPVYIQVTDVGAARALVEKQVLLPNEFVQTNYTKLQWPLSLQIKDLDEKVILASGGSGMRISAHEEASWESNAQPSINPKNPQKVLYFALVNDKNNPSKINIVNERKFKGR